MYTRAQFKDVLRQELTRHVTLEDPIFGELFARNNWPLLRLMALQGYQLTKVFLEYVETLFFHCPKGNHKRRLLMNLFEEETGHLSRTDNHVVLMENFLRAIGISEEERDAARALPSTQALIDYRMQLVRNPETFHLGAAAVMIGSEGQNLETLGTTPRHNLLQRAYGLTDADVLFFSVHQKEDRGHVQEGIELVADVCDDEHSQQAAIATVGTTCRLFREMYAGVASEYAAQTGTRSSAELAPIRAH